MRSRFEYEAPGLLKKAALTLKAPHKWRSRVRMGALGQANSGRMGCVAERWVASAAVVSFNFSPALRGVAILVCTDFRAYN